MNYGANNFRNGHALRICRVACVYAVMLIAATAARAVSVSQTYSSVSVTWNSTTSKIDWSITVNRNGTTNGVSQYGEAFVNTTTAYGSGTVVTLVVDKQGSTIGTFTGSIATTPGQWVHIQAATYQWGTNVLIGSAVQDWMQDPRGVLPSKDVRLTWTNTTGAKQWVGVHAVGETTFSWDGLVEVNPGDTYDRTVSVAGGDTRTFEIATVKLNETFAQGNGSIGTVVLPDGTVVGVTIPSGYWTSQGTPVDPAVSGVVNVTGNNSMPNSTASAGKAINGVTQISNPNAITTATPSAGLTEASLVNATNAITAAINANKTTTITGGGGGGSGGFGPTDSANLASVKDSALALKTAQANAATNANNAATDFDYSAKNTAAVASGNAAATSGMGAATSAIGTIEAPTPVPDPGSPDSDSIDVQATASTTVKFLKNPFDSSGPFGGVLGAVAAWVKALIGWGIVAAFLGWAMGRVREMCQAPFNVTPFGDTIPTTINNIRIFGTGISPMGYAAKIAIYALLLAVLLTMPLAIVNAVTTALPWTSIKATFSAGIGAPATSMGVAAWKLANVVVPFPTVFAAPTWYFLVEFVLFPSQMFWAFFIKFIPA